MCALEADLYNILNGALSRRIDDTAEFRRRRRLPAWFFLALNLRSVKIHPNSGTSRKSNHAVNGFNGFRQEVLMYAVPLNQELLVRRVYRRLGYGYVNAGWR